MSGETASALVLVAGGSGGAELEPFALVMGLFGGLALFLFGMDQMSESLKAVAGDRMRSILAALTTNRVTGLLTGAFVTAVIQSSSVTTVLVVGFVSAGLMSLSQSIGVILGADIGTTVTAQIIAFKITKYALGMVAAGFALQLLGRKESSRLWGTCLMGLGLIFFGMSIMGDAMSPLRSSSAFLGVMTRMESPLFGILIATLFTALVQSSSATTGIVIVMASQGLVTLKAGIALIFGANIGTCVTAILASIGKPREAVRAGTVHVIFKIVGVLIWLPFIDGLAFLVTAISPAAEGLTGTERLAQDAPRQIANAHTVFNVVNGLLFLPFAAQFARLVEWLIPERPLAEEDTIRARYLDSELLTTPSLALDRARLELLRLGDRTKAMLVASLPAVLEGSPEELAGLAELDDAVDQLHGKIITYLGRISQTTLTEAQTDEMIRLMEATNDLENIGDIIETNLVALGGRRRESRVRVSAETRALLETFHGEVVKALDHAMVAVTQRNDRAASLVVDLKPRINELAAEAALHQAQRLVADAPQRLEAYSLETDTIENLKRIYYFCKRIARAATARTEA